MNQHDTLTRFSRDMDGSMEPDENGSWVRFEDAQAALSATQPAQAAQGEPDTDAHTLAHNMMMWVNDARQHNSEYVPVHVSTLEKMICYLSQKSLQMASSWCQRSAPKP